MGIYIKGMELPGLELELSVRRGADGKWYAVDTNAETSDGEWHEIIPIPQHGRLIDASEMFIEFVIEGQKSKRYKLGERWELNGEEIRRVIERLPTIIPASEEER